MVIQESFGGGDPILMPSGALGLAKLTKPTLYNKLYAFRSGRAISDGSTATGAETEGVYTITVDSANRSNTLFSGITFTDGKAQLFTVGSTDEGKNDNSRLKALNYAMNVNGVSGTLLAYPTGSTPSIAFNDIPAGTTIGDQKTQARIITFGVNFGALCRDKGANITSENLTLWRNAVYMLAGLTVPTTPVTGIKQQPVTAPEINVYPNPTSSYIQVNGMAANAFIRIFDVTGKVVFNGKANANEMSIDLSSCTPGLYLLQVESNGTLQHSKILKR
jgi:hypothetical protein